MALSEQLKYTDQGPPSVPYKSVFDYDGSGSLIYEGWADCGSATSSAVWGIKKYTFNGSNQLTTIQFLNGGVQQVGIWDNRAALSYS